MLQDELGNDSRTIYLETMDERVYFQRYITKKYGDTKVQYQDWYEYVTEHHQEDVTDLVFPQAFE